MTTNRKTMLVHEDRFVAEIRVETNPDFTTWVPYLAAVDAERLDAHRAALHRDHQQTAGTLENLYTRPAVLATD
jgi:hypothetical protein